MKRIAHLSDLHLGKSAPHERAARALAKSLSRSSADVIVVSGDVTDKGRRSEHALFSEIFAGVADRLCIVPGNHDRLGTGEAADLFMPERSALAHGPGMSLLRINSTGAHNRSLFTPQGEITGDDLAAIDAKLTAMPRHALRIAVLHHHPVALPADDAWERLGGWLRITRNEQLHSSLALLSTLAGRVDVVLHGHRHRLHHHRLGGLEIVAGGSSSEQQGYRMLSFDDHVLSRIDWVSVEAQALRPCLTPPIADLSGA
jgi:3',5'-cyclic AMP phosphodiesterase CpdA